MKEVTLQDLCDLSDIIIYSEAHLRFTILASVFKNFLVSVCDYVEPILSQHQPINLLPKLREHVGGISSEGLKILDMPFRCMPLQMHHKENYPMLLVKWRIQIGK